MHKSCSQTDQPNRQACLAGLQAANHCSALLKRGSSIAKSSSKPLWHGTFNWCPCQSLVERGHGQQSKLKAADAQKCSLSFTILLCCLVWYG